MIPLFYMDPAALMEGVSVTFSEPEPEKPAPQLVAECWQTAPVDAARAWAAVVALSRGQ